MVPYFIVAGIDMAGLHSTAVTLHYVFVALIPTYSIFGGLHFINMVGVMNSFSYAPRPSFVSGSHALPPPPPPPRQDEKTTVMSDFFEMDNLVLPTYLIMLGHLVFWLALLDAQLLLGGAPGALQGAGHQRRH